MDQERVTCAAGQGLCHIRRGVPGNASQLVLQEEKEAPTYSVCRFPWCEYLRHGQIQAIHVNSLDMAVARGAHFWPL